jgi:hypothetical protein
MFFASRFSSFLHFILHSTFAIFLFSAPKYVLEQRR